jgi:hypothetical protein
MMHRRATRAVFALTLLAGIATLGATSATAAQPTRAALPPSASGAFTAVAAVPHTGDAYLIATRGPGADNEKFFVVRRHKGHLTKVWAPKLGGRYGHLDSVAALSSSLMFVGGAVQGGDLQQTPHIFHLVKGKFIAFKLPALDSGATGVGSISISSAKNAWAVGAIYPRNASGGPQALHWDGTKWSLVVTPNSSNYDGLTAVSTSGANNAWGTRGDGELLHWDGKTWNDAGAPLPGGYLSGVATSSAKLAYVAGVDSAGKSRILKYNGTKWSAVKIMGAPGNISIGSLTLRGTSGWATATYPGSNSKTVSLILHSTGGQWTVQGKVSGGLNFLSSISAASATSAIAAGAHYPDFHTDPRTLADLLIGHTWKPVNSNF